ncbi:MAG: ATP phosphoribosyltransferase, partial [Candidatus Lindowbacteria bacterium]|nr:ATP phosphoribosyltransferase [Candidatus Lindowbacteria bacterium]
MDNSLKIALPKGRLLDEALKFFSPIGIEFPGIKETKKLRVPSSDGAFEALIVRAADVPVYVAYGAADLGIVGKDVLWESADGEDELYELADLGFGSCKLVVAGSQDGPPKFPMWRVATKYPISTEKYFQEQGRPV